MATTAKRLIEMGLVPPLAKELADNILEIGTTGTTAMAGNRTPTATIRGGALLMPTLADSTATDVAGLKTDFNALLAELRTAGLLASS